jgi:hypothetical protein
LVIIKDTPIAKGLKKVIHAKDHSILTKKSAFFIIFGHMKLLFTIVAITSFLCPGFTQDHSVARHWNEATLLAIRNDFARPTVHARNLFHTSIALYDSWALFDNTATTYLIGKSHGDFQSAFRADSLDLNQNEIYMEEVASFAVYRLLQYRFRNSPKANESNNYFDSLMISFNYDISLVSVDYADGQASSLGNFIALEIINYGLLDGSNEAIDYGNIFYEPLNQPLNLSQPGNPNMENPDRWQPLAFDTFIDQSGNLIPGNIPDFLSPEWGNVSGFTLNTAKAQKHERDGHTYYVYHDPGPPPYLQGMETERNQYQWGFSMVAHWSSHLDSSDSVMWDISPRNIGNISSLPSSMEDYSDFYQLAGGDNSQGYDINPQTNLPYESQIVPRGDYTRVLAEFWADGPDSETPPGHWFTILNYVMDHPSFEKKYKGTTTLKNSFEYDIKAYFILGAAMHDVAITSWALKGWYDYVRPISAIRYMNVKGQSSNLSSSDYHFQGLPLTAGYVEIIKKEDPLSANVENIGKIKIKAWKGPDFITDPAYDEAGVDWILAENWWPYQRPTFVTPPFAGYISGHSTYSRAAAEVITMLTGDPYFPGGMGEFIAKKNDFLVFENGPSTDVILQWATYRDASDQCSLSRIWGGIHPPADDIIGRKIGIIIGTEVFALAENYFNGQAPLFIFEKNNANLTLYPNPVNTHAHINIKTDSKKDDVKMYDSTGRLIHEFSVTEEWTKLSTHQFIPGIYYLKSTITSQVKKLIVR